MTRRVISEPVTPDQAREAIRATALSDNAVKDLIQAAREAAEAWTHITIAQSEFTDDEGIVITGGYTPVDCPAGIKDAMYVYMVARHEMAATADWLQTFRDLLLPWRKPICD